MKRFIIAHKKENNRIILLNINDIVLIHDTEDNSTFVELRYNSYDAIEVNEKASKLYEQIEGQE